MGICELIRKKMWNCDSVLKISYAVQIPEASLYLFRSGKKSLSATNLQKLADYFHLRLVEEKV